MAINVLTLTLNFCIIMKKTSNYTKDRKMKKYNLYAYLSGLLIILIFSVSDVQAITWSRSCTRIAANVSGNNPTSATYDPNQITLEKKYTLEMSVDRSGIIYTSFGGTIDPNFTEFDKDQRPIHIKGTNSHIMDGYKKHSWQIHDITEPGKETKNRKIQVVGHNKIEVGTTPLGDPIYDYTDVSGTYLCTPWAAHSDQATCCIQ